MSWASLSAHRATRSNSFQLPIKRFVETFILILFITILPKAMKWYNVRKKEWENIFVFIFCLDRL